MKIKQIGEYDGDIISTILKNRDIDDIDLFLNPSKESMTDSFKLNNMLIGAKVVLAHLLIGNHIGILVDADADGFTSSSIIYQYLKKIKPDAKISYFLHDKKSHGLTEYALDQISATDIDLLIIPDAASNDDEQVQKLYYMGIDIVIIDHHEVENIPQYAILINNQLDWNEEANKDLVGAGLVFKFCQALDEILSVNYSEDFYDLVALGQIGDVSDISEKEIRYMVVRGLKEIKNPFVKVVLEDKFGSLDNIAPVDVAFSIIPLINAVVRVGTLEEKDILFRALNSINAHETFKVNKRKKNKETGKFETHEVTLNLYEYAYEICKKAKNRQDLLVKKTLVDLEKDIDNTGGVAIGILKDIDEDGSITGLVANKVVSKLQKPVLLFHYVDGKYVGSGRGYEKALPSFKDWCNETNLVEFAHGHANAFGISVPEENFEEFKKKVKELTPQEPIYEVDLWLHGKVDKKVILKVVENKHLFGGKVFDPLFAFTGIRVNKQFIKQRGSTLVFYEDGVEFIMFNAPSGLYEKLTYNFDRFIIMDFVGKPSVNTWGGRMTPQLILVDCERSDNPVVEEKKVEKVTPETIVF
jgi:single-stranded-DNA-specific exonuclease